ncbi:aminotransferase class I/II-fold pyridoxal phosphate-dependent enzyme [Actinoalloteichus hymeniacidonis]|uniref:Aminotransferase n=1 Tax=Actinoalloteichus hymeniacidonis TaxID=340345 RepID=A0AAC9HUJ7_9PSEU|nr:aminotransferase class I/II-fold pyridoxal phosphate-dependent enzyme [Actinoalloteichus hymeniacidonis]AOS65997.1 aspartate/tyrosine/aromatic aminotransferase [Actinoalloteichus hymeniacidonis]MBB5905901.1 aspartate/methionine/tyrosine aminotransferase [Actinoalloteichus hymeniacidonis]
MSAALDPLRVATRAQVPPFYVMNVVSAAARRAREHGDVISLVAGQPATPAPAPVLAAAAEAMHSSALGYTEQLGTHELRSAIACHYRTRYDLAVAAEDVVVTAGASGAFLLAFLSCFEAGDRVALARPGYPAYRNILRALGCEVVELATGPETRFQPTPAMLAALDEPVRGLIVASPANPTGSTVTGAELRELSEWCAANGVRLISDEIYHGISYGAETASSWQFDRRSVVVNSFSKYWSMTGWRLGWALVPEELRESVAALAGNFTVCPPALAQHAALAAFTPESYAASDAQVARYRTNRDLLISGLAELGITRVAPADGAFYVYADVSHLTEDSMSFCDQLLAETGVAVVPGIDFDPIDGGRFIRMSVAGSTEDVAEALRRLGPWLAARG